VLLVIWIRPETKRSNLEQAEVLFFWAKWKAEPVFVAINWDDLRFGVKS